MCAQNRTRSARCTFTLTIRPAYGIRCGRIESRFGARDGTLGALGFGDIEPRFREGYWVPEPAAALAVLATLMSSFAGFAHSAAAQAADLSHVGGWATLGSVTPAAGCWLDASIEVREAGGGISDVAVGVNLVHDGEVVWADWGMTDADGLAYLSVDTSWAAPGYEAWMDVLVGGEYAGGMPVSITDSGGCADNPDMVELSADVTVAQASGTAQNWSTSDSGASDAVRVGVPTYAQQRNLSCEYAALVMAMGAYGVWVSEYEFDDLRRLVRESTLGISGRYYRLVGQYRRLWRLRLRARSRPGELRLLGRGILRPGELDGAHRAA